MVFEGKAMMEKEVMMVMEAREEGAVMVAGEAEMVTVAEEGRGIQEMVAKVAIEAKEAREYRSREENKVRKTWRN